MNHIQCLIREGDLKKYKVLAINGTIDLVTTPQPNRLINIVESNYLSGLESFNDATTSKDGIHILWMSDLNLMRKQGKFLEDCFQRFDCIATQNTHIQDMLSVRHVAEKLIRPRLTNNYRLLKRKQQICTIFHPNQSHHNLINLIDEFRKIPKGFSKIAILDQISANFSFQIEDEIYDVFDKVLPIQLIDDVFKESLYYISSMDFGFDDYVLDAMNNSLWCFVSNSNFYGDMPDITYKNSDSFSETVQKHFDEYPQILNNFGESFVNKSYHLDNFRLQLFEIIHKILWSTENVKENIGTRHRRPKHEINRI